MNHKSHPTSAAEITNWANTNNLALSEARLRFAQYGILYAIAGSRSLNHLLVFKGGNALDFVWKPNRSTIDLDFSLVSNPSQEGQDVPNLLALLQRSLNAAGRDLGIVFNAQSIEPRNPAPSRTFITYTIKVGWAFPTEQRLAHVIASGQPVSRVIPVEISINEEICATQNVELVAGRTLRISTIEDIIAEKLRAILQQPIRNRYRRQDILDVATCLADPDTASLSRAEVTQYLLKKAHARKVTVSRSAFHQQEVWERAAVDYDELESTTRAHFIAFDDARSVVLAFIEELDIPD